MNVACDWGGALEVNESLRQLARDLHSEGHGVFVIPALGLWEFPYEQALSDLEVPVNGIHRVRLDPPFPEAVAAAKIAMMRRLGCTVLYDDNQDNVNAVNIVGMVGVLVCGNEAVSRIC